VRTGPSYVLVVIPAACRLDLQLIREALGDNHARLVTEEELDRDSANYQLGALPPLGALVGDNVFVDPEVLGHDTVVFAAGTQTELVKMSTQELFWTGGTMTVALVKRPERASDEPSRRRGGTVRRRSHDPLGSDLAPPVGDAARRALADSMTPGLAVALVCHGRIAWAAGYGVADPGEGAVGDALRPASRPLRSRSR
jgi:hypothetical protein